MTQRPPASGRLLASYARRLGRRIAGLCAIALGASALTAIQPVLIAALLATVLGSSAAGAASGGLFDLNGVGSWVIGWLGVSGGTVSAVAILGALFVGHAVLTAGFDYASALTATGIRTQCARLIQRDLLRHLLSQGLAFFQRERSGELVSRFSQDAYNAGHGLGPVVRVFVTSAAQIVVYGAYLVSTDAWLTAVAAALVLVHIGLSQKRSCQEVCK